MGKIVANFFISLDGVVESPHEWHFAYFNDEMGNAIGSGMASTDAVLMGRVLYSEWSEYWPGKTDDFGPFINSIPKYVISDSLTEATWENTRIIPGSGAVDAVGKLKESVDREIMMSGCATTVRWLLANGLLDELRLLVHPIAVGRGQRLFTEVRQPLTLLSSETFSTGVLSLVYAPAAAS
jgi:dihydrofolate reductase